MKATIPTLTVAAALLALSISRAAAGQAFVGLQVLPEHPTIHDPLRITVAEFSDFDPQFAIESIEEDRVVIVGTHSQFGGVPPAGGHWSETFTLPPRPAGPQTVEFRFTREPFVEIHRQDLRVLPPDTSVSLHAGRFRVGIDWQDPRDGALAPGFARALGDQAGAFYFFDPDNLEVTVKILDGRPVNEHFWVFIASMTDVRFTLTIEDCPPQGLPAACRTRTYEHPAGRNRNFIDTRAFFELARGAAGTPARGAAQVAPPSFEGIQISPENPTVDDPIRITVATPQAAVFALDSAGPEGIVIRGRDSDQILGIPPYAYSETYTVGPLSAGAHEIRFDLQLDFRHYTRAYARTLHVTEPEPSLPLHAGRFRVTLDWETPSGELRGRGLARPLTDQSGLFWFFDPSNPEVTVKILDGTRVNGRYWVFIANMSSVGFTVNVEDCPLGFARRGPSPLSPPCATRTYRNPPSENRNFIDTRAFP
jgi:hypothetical protein